MAKAKKVAKKPLKKAVKKVIKKTIKKITKKAVAKKATAKTVKKALTKKPIQKKSAPKSKATITARAIEKLIPLDDRIVVEVALGEKMTAGGLYIPDTVSDVSGNHKGKVIAIGRGRQDKKGKIHALDVKAGDQILFDEYAGTKIQLNQTDYVILRESEVLGIVSK